MKAITTESFWDANNTGLITWSGKNIPCLNICTGDNLNVVMTIIAEKVCELFDPYDLSELTLTCALDIFNRDEPANRTIANVLQLLLDNDCGLKELIDNLQAQVDGIAEDNFVIDLKCLKEVDSYGNQLDYTIQSVCQQFVNEICDLRSDISSLAGNITVMKKEIIKLQEDMPSGNEPIISTCVSATSKPVSASVIDLASEYCNYKKIVGNAAQIQTALSKQTSAMNSVMSSVTGWITTPTTIADGLNNVYLMFSNILPRVAANELCCGSTCDDIKVGFITDIQNNTAILKFTSGAGTFIPSGFEDTGSSLTITDELGHYSIVNITVSQNGETDEIDLSMFDVGSNLDFNIDLKMASDTNTCQKCINKNVKYLNSDCCTITAISDVTIIYSMPIPNTLT